MEANLNKPWSKEVSLPVRSLITFYSKEADNLIFKKSKKITIFCKSGYCSVSLNWTISKNLFTTPFLSGKGKPIPGNIFIINIPAEKLKPGFYDLKVYIDVAEKQMVTDICTFGYEIGKIRYCLTKPDNFEKFWNNAKKSISTVPLQPEEIFIQEMTNNEIDQYNVKSACLPPRYDPGIRYDKIEVYKVSFSSINRLRVYGWLAKPFGKGPFPGMLVFPGAGYRPEPIPAEHARHGYVAIDIQVHNQEVDQNKYEKPLWEKISIDYNKPETSEFYTMYLNCLQTVNYLVSRKDVDSNKIVAVGGSQGGRLSIISASLDTRIKAIVPAILWGANFMYQKWAEKSNLKGSDGTNAFLPEYSETLENKFISYFDPMNFAPDVRCPVLMNAGLRDTVSPPSCVHSVFKLLGTKDKKIIFLPELGHDWSAEFDRYAWRWLERKLQKRI